MSRVKRAPWREASASSWSMACGSRGRPTGAARRKDVSASMSEVTGVLSSWEATVRNSLRARTASWDAR